jgi:uncharacterized damage-inducible protein DinB
MSGRDNRRLAAALTRMHDGGAWHGPSMREALAGVTAAEAGAHPVPGAHSIYELTHHLAAWTGEVARRLQGGAPTLPEDGDWPAPDVRVDEEAWAAVQTRLATRNAALVALVTALPADRFAERVGTSSDPATGTGISLYGMLHGLVQHDAYHAGQIVLLRRALGGA